MGGPEKESITRSGNTGETELSLCRRTKNSTVPGLSLVTGWNILQVRIPDSDLALLL